MKHRSTKIIFQTAAVLLIFSSVAYAQDKKVKETVIIKDGDTTINGQNLSKVSEEKRAALRQKFMEMEKELTEKSKHLKNMDLHERDIIIKHPGKPLIRKFDEGDVRVFSMGDDTTITRILKRFDGTGEGVIAGGPGRVRSLDLHDFRSDPPAHGFSLHREMSNSQSFSYSATDKDGIANRAHIRISDVKRGR